MSEQEIKPLVEYIDEAQERFLEVAPSGIVFDSEKSFAGQLLSNNTYLRTVAEQAPKSLKSAMMNVASIGLSLNPAKAQAYLIPRKVKIGNKYESRIFLDPSYRGMCDIATGTGCVEWIQADIVRAADKFALNGVDQMPTHERDPFNKERGEVTGAYCVAKLPSGDYLTTAMSIEELHKVRDGSEAWKASINKGGTGAGPWKDWPEEMMKKTVVRRAFKMWPKAKEFDRMAEVVNISNENEGMETIETRVEANDFTADQQAYFQQMIDSSDAIGMFLFMSSLEHGVQTALYNSFPKGKITSGKQLVSNMITDGRAQIVDCQDAITELAASEDDMAVKQYLEELSEEAIAYISENSDSETAEFIKGCRQELAA